MITGTIAIGCLLASAFFATACFSLRNFLRSRLALVCRTHNNEERFGVILRADEVALQACETLLFVTLTLFVTITVFAYGPIAPKQLNWPHLIEGAGLIVVVWGAVVVIPWSLSRIVGEPFLYHTWPVLELAVTVMRPIHTIEGSIDTLFHRIAGRKDPTPENLETIAEEIQSVVDEGEREGILETRAGRMIQRVMELRQEDVRAVMTPRTDIISIDVSCGLEEARQQLLEAGHSRIPVVEGNPDDIVGILYARDLLEHIVSDTRELTLRDIVREPFYVPETTTIDALLERMKLARLHMSIVLDEYGGVTGLVTLEDILEEIVGDIADEFDEAESEQVQRIDERTLEVDARMHIDELNDMFELDLPEEGDFDTIAGFVFTELGRIPKRGESLRWKTVTIVVVEVTSRKITRLRLLNDVAWPVERHESIPDNSLSGIRSPEAS